MNVLFFVKTKNIAVLSVAVGAVEPSWNPHETRPISVMALPGLIWVVPETLSRGAILRRVVLAVSTCLGEITALKTLLSPDTVSVVNAFWQIGGS